MPGECGWRGTSRGKKRGKLWSLAEGDAYCESSLSAAAADPRGRQPARWALLALSVVAPSGYSGSMTHPAPPGMTEDEWSRLGGPHPTTVSPTLMVTRPPAQIAEGLLDRSRPKAAGVVRLPPHVAWSPPYEYDLADRHQCCRAYQRVMTEGSVAPDGAAATANLLHLAPLGATHIVRAPVGAGRTAIGTVCGRLPGIRSRPRG